MIVDDVLDERPDARDKDSTALLDVRRVEEGGEPREVIGPVESSEEIKALANEGLKMGGLCVAGGKSEVKTCAKNAPHDVVKGGGLKEGTEKD